MTKKLSKTPATKKLVVQDKKPLPVFEHGSSNVFADLDLPNPAEDLAKAELARQIYHIIKRKRLTQVKAGALLGIDQAKVSALMSGKISGFSLERLFRFLNDLGQDIAIKVKPKAQSKEKGSISISSTAGASTYVR